MSKMSFGVDDDDDTGDVDVGDDELEAELNALMAGQDIRKYKRGDAFFEEPISKARGAEMRKSSPSKPPAPQARAPPQRPSVATLGQKPAPPPQARRSAPHAPIRDEMGDDDDSDIDENDPDLLAELHKYLPTDSPKQGSTSGSSREAVFDVALARELEHRIAAFESSIEGSRNSGDVGKLRRLQRQSEQVSSALADVKANRPVNVEEIPMPPSAASSRRESAVPSNTSSPTEQRAPKLPSPTEHAAHPVVSPYADALDSGRSSNVISTQPPHHAQTPTPAASVNSFNQANAGHSTSSGPHLHNEAHETLMQQEQQLKVLAVQAKRSGNLEQAKAYLTQYKQVKEQLDALSGKEIERATYKLPAPTSATSVNNNNVHAQTPQAQQQQQQLHQQRSPAADHRPEDSLSPEALPHLSEQRLKELTGAPPPPTSIAEALQQRLAKYKDSVEKARAEPNESKARRMERIVKQYEEAVKDHKRGRPVDFESLPSPPGFGPIPVPGAAAHPAPTAAGAAAPSARAPAASTSAASHGVAQPRASTSAAAAASQRTSNQVQLNALVEKQKQFKLAALKAKNDGDIPLAKEYLRKAKGLEQMIEASQSGLPVNLETVPAAPTNKDHYGYEVVSTATLSELRPNVKFDRTAVFKQLEVDLINQVKMCKSNSDTFSKAGDVDMAKRFQIFLKDSIRDLEALRNAFQHNDAPPRFHYETRSFNLAKVHADLAENILELHIVRAVGLHVKEYEPSQMDTFVVYDFPSPSENHQTNRTPTFRSTNSPTYNSTFNIEINRRNRAIERIFKKQGIKCEIFLKGGFLRADRLIGRVFIDLQQLETKCEMHQAFDVVDEKRKPLSGKLEVKLRLREPLSGKHIEPVKETWLVIDEFSKSK